MNKLAYRALIFLGTCFSCDVWYKVCNPPTWLFIASFLFIVYLYFVAKHTDDEE